jgi:hypothetical protein
MRIGMYGCNLVVNILVMIFGTADRTLMGQKTEIVVAEFFLGMRMIYAWLILQRLLR